MASEGRGERRVFHALDGMRGVAALFVAMRHTAFFHKLGIPGGYMAVDLFFVLSGFVIAHAYERRFQEGLSAGRFLALRYVRLWPVYALGAVIGLLAALLHALPGRDNLSAAQVAQTAPYALAMLPGPHIRQMLYPVNSVAWSLALELTVNAVYALCWRPLRRPLVLAVSLAVSAAALVAAVAWFGKLDIGFLWRDWIGGLPRVAFSFTAGLAIYQLYRRRGLALKAPAWALLAPLPVLFCLPLGETVYPLVCVLLIFPALVFAIASAPEPGARQARLFALLGAASYPLYALHKPLGELVVLGLRHIAPQMVDRTPLMTGVPYLVLLLAVSLLVERWFDQPVRRALNGGIGRVSRVLRRWAGIRLWPLAPDKSEDAIAER
ncbi:acyltransferase family protein [Phenylobacterium montanum]|uniref:Acyltransferase n=1 Tax=Phenylobacterium montanum TaxID=2823693 RepID=A0A975IU52_9CAUL|nr:acyltransferase [Caulobacter sp. S6]QUD87438.1 acyltransferase [Caulobacter sp. S6]